MEKRKLYGVGNLFDLSIQSTDIFIRDIWNLFENQLFNLWSRQLL